MSTTPPGWYDDGSGAERWWNGTGWEEYRQQPDQESSAQPPDGAGIAGVVQRIEQSAVAGALPHGAIHGASYVVLQVILKEKFWGTGSGNLPELERAINAQASLGYRLHTITTSASGSKGLGGGDRIQATMVFERIS